MYQRKSVWILFGLFLISCLWPVLMYSFRAYNQPQHEDYQQAAAYIQQVIKEHDGITLSPWYHQEIMTLLPSQPVKVLRSLHPHDFITNEYIHVVHLTYALGESIRPQLQELYQLHDSKAFGAILYERYKNNHYQPMVFDFVENIRSAKVSAQYAEQAVVCNYWNTYRWDCPKEPKWNFVGPEYLDYDNVPRKLLWAHPLSSNKPLTVTYDQISLGKKIIGMHAFTRWATTRAQAPVSLKIYINNQLVQTNILPVHMGVNHFEIDTTAWQTPASVSFTITSVNNQSAHYGFAAYSIGN